MAKITYVYHATDENGGVTWHGLRFMPNKAVETDNEDLIKAAKDHPHFEVKGAGEDNASAEVSKDERAPRGRRKKAEEEVVSEIGAYRVVQVGEDSFAVKMASETIAEGLSKDEAEDQAMALASHQPGGPTA